MKKILSLLMLGALVCATSCKNEEQKQPIITKIVPKPAKPSGPLKMHESASQPVVVDWVTGKYTITVAPHCDPELPLARDEQGQEYYDNKIDVEVKRGDGSVFFHRTFSKADFSKFLDEHTRRDGAMLGMPFIRVEDSQLVFGASVGSPDESSDEYIPFTVTVSRMGDVHIERDAQLEQNGQEPTEDEGV